MKLPLRTAVAAIALVAATPAAASIVFDFNTGTLTVDANTTIGDSVTISFNGYAPNNPPIPGLTADLTLTFMGLGMNGFDYKFSYLLANTSGAPIDDSRVTVFGFTDVNPNVSLAGSSVTGGYTTVASGNFPGGTDLEFCAKNGQNNNCAGSQGGPALGSSVSGNLQVGFTSFYNQILFGGLAIRWQGIDSASLGITDGSAIGSPTPPPAVPEPATWAMMLMGFGGVGYAFRRRRKTVLAQVA